ncbi:MAG: ATP-binding protein [Pseudomonadota bacterium]|nr:ATP-binding protein [Pseudomonadota bacterium]
MGSFFWFSAYYEKTVLEDYKTSFDAILTQELNKKFALVKAAAVSYSNYSVIQDAMVYEDRELIAREIRPMKTQFAKWTDYKRYAFHFILDDGRSLYKSFNEESFGQDLSDHPLIKEAIRTQQPVSRMEVGGYGEFYRIIAIQPIFDREEPQLVIGYLAVSQGLRRLVMDMPKFGYQYSLFVQDDGIAAADPSQERTYSLDQRVYFKDSPIKAETFIESQLSHRSIIDIEDFLVYVNPVLDEQERPIAFHAVKIPKSEFHQRVWDQQKSLLWILLLVFSVIALLGAAHIFRVKRDVVKPLVDITDNIRLIIRTQDYKQKISYIQDDEIGELADFFNELLDTTDQLVFSLKYLEKAIDQTLMVSRTDPYGTITYVNEQFCKISGYSQEELVGFPHNIVRHPDMSSSTFKEIWSTIQSKKTWSGEIKNRAKDGSTYYVNSHIIPVVDYKNNILEFMSIREDITMMVQLREQLQDNVIEIEKEKHAAEQANRAKSEFLSSMSHELRTPLNAIIGFSQLLEISELSDRQLKQIKNIEASGQHLLDLIDDILEFAKLDAGSLSLSIEKLAVCSIINEMFALAQSQAGQEGITLNIEGDQEQDFIIKADRVRLKQVCLNLLSNAIKYNKKGGQVFIEWQEVAVNGKSYWQFLVRDTGFGIPEEKLSQLFEPFNRLGHEGSNIEGTGIGLSITKNLIEKMNGWIEVESEVGVGSRFAIYLPLVKRCAIQPGLGLTLESSGEHKETHLVDDSAIRVHYIEDNPTNMELMVDIIESIEGAELKISPTAENGIEQARTFQPHIMFIDINLPGMDGDEALTYLKALPELQKMGTRFYALSANVMMNQIQKGLDAGFDDYLTKPIDVQKIIALIKSVKEGVEE